MLASHPPPARLEAAFLEGPKAPVRAWYLFLYRTRGMSQATTLGARPAAGDHWPDRDVSVPLHRPIHDAIRAAYFSDLAGGTCTSAREGEVLVVRLPILSRSSALRCPHSSKVYSRYGNDPHHGEQQ